jgi:hypothetical protein
MKKHLDRYFPAYFLGFLICGVVAIAVKNELADRTFEVKCRQLGGEPRTLRERLCLRPGALLEVSRG